MLSAFFLRTRDVINKSRLIFRLTIYWHIDRDAIWIGRDAANIYRDASRRDACKAVSPIDG